MPTLEERVQKLEDEVRDIRSRTDVNEAETLNLAELIKVESRFTNSKIDRLSRDMTSGLGGLQTQVNELKRDMTDVKQELKALPRVIAEVVRETVAELKPRN